MERHFDRELESLKTMLMKMASMAEDNFQNAMRSLVEKDVQLADQVIRADGRVDALELEIDNAVVDILALQKPVASDLRLIIAAQKINNDLERISDHAVNIAQSAITISASAQVTSMLEIPAMADLTRAMLRECAGCVPPSRPRKSAFGLQTGRYHRRHEPFKRPPGDRLDQHEVSPGGSRA